jgi:hypothetical protein
MPARAPRVSADGVLDLRIPRQHGRGELDRGLPVTVLYVGSEPAWLRLPSGTALETRDHPRRAAPMLAWLAVFLIGMGAFWIETAVRSARSGGGWWRRVPMEATLGVPFTAMIAGMFGSIAQALAGGTAWPGVLAAALGVVLTVAGRRWVRRRARASL